MVGKFSIIAGLCFLSLFLHAQDRDRDRDRPRDEGRAVMTRVESDTVIAVRVNEAIDVERKDNRIYTGIVDQDVRGDNGRLAIPRGSS